MNIWMFSRNTINKGFLAVCISVFILLLNKIKLKVSLKCFNKLFTENSIIHASVKKLLISTCAHKCIYTLLQTKKPSFGTKRWMAVNPISAGVLENRIMINLTPPLKIPCLLSKYDKWYINGKLLCSTFRICKKFQIIQYNYIQ